MAKNIKCDRPPKGWHCDMLRDHDGPCPTIPDEDLSTISEGEFHPAARSAYRWLKGFMVTNQRDYLMYKEALASAALSGNRQAEICMGTIERLRKSQPISDRYLLGLCWTILHLHNHDAMEAISSARVDPAYPPSSEELLLDE